MVDVSVIIVNYNAKSLLNDCLRSIYSKTNTISFEVLVSDNGSTDGSIEMLQSDFPQVIIIENGKNIGFGAANNRALSQATGEYILYLNNDTVLINNAIKIFYDYFKLHEHEKLGAIGCMLYDSERHYIHSYGTFPSYKLCLTQLFVLNITINILSLLYLFNIPVSVLMHKKASVKQSLSFSSEKDVDFVTGADLFLRNNEMAHFDERYFLYFEDSTLQYALMKKHLLRRIIPGPQIYHFCGGSVKEEMNLYRKVSFSRIQFEFSRIQWIMDRYGEKSIYVLLAKLFIIHAWINPLLLKKTAKYILEIMTFKGKQEHQHDQ